MPTTRWTSRSQIQSRSPMSTTSGTRRSSRLRCPMTILCISRSSCASQRSRRGASLPPSGTATIAFGPNDIRRDCSLTGSQCPQVGRAGCPGAPDLPGTGSRAITPLEPAGSILPAAPGSLVATTIRQLQAIRRTCGRVLGDHPTATL